MYVCRGCLRSLTGAVVSPAGPRLFSSLRTSTAAVSNGRPYRGKGIKADLKNALADQTDLNNALADPTDPKEQPSSSRGKKASGKKQGGGGNEDLAYENLHANAGELAEKNYERKLDSAVRKRLNLFPDPFHIAQQVNMSLDKDSFDEALMLTRLASRNKKVEVSWNHLIDYQMRNQRLNAAIKLYNEMKKRAQLPNAKTYTIIFRGCAQSQHPKLAVSEATRIYNFMIKHGPLKPNTIHMNAVLAVCARAGDLENLFTILSTANGNMRAPDAHTYTIVLTALQHDAKIAGKANLGLVDSDVKREIQNNIKTASSIWADAVANWRGAKMIMDEHLVSAMGRILCRGDAKDNESVLELLEQTMKIPRLDKPNVKLPVVANAGRSRDDTDTDSAALAPVPAPEQKMPDLTKMSPKDRKLLAQSRTSTTPLYPKPGPKTISLVLTALINLRKTASVPKYWSYMTNNLNITPDPENYYRYLHALMAGHASAQTAALIEEMPKPLLAAVTFRRGMSACVGDNLNPAAFRNACRIFDVMIATQRYPDALSMRLFLQVARANTRHLYEKPNITLDTTPTDLEASKKAHGQQLTDALERMWEPFRILSGSLSYPVGSAAARSPKEELDKKRGDMQEIMATGRRMIAALDRVVTDELVTDRATVKLLRTRRAVLQRQVERWILKLYPDGAPAEFSQHRGNKKKDGLEEEDEELRREIEAGQGGDHLGRWFSRQGR